MADSDKTLEVILKIKDLASEELKRFGKEAKNAGKATTESFTESSGAIKSFLGSMLGLPLTLGAVALALKTVFIDTFSWSEELGKTALRIGATTDQVQIFEYAAAKTGTQMGVFTGIARFLAEKMDDVKKETRGASDNFEEFGVDIQGIVNKGGTATDVIMAVSDAIKGLDSATRGIAVTKMLGRQGLEIMPMLLEDYEKLRQRFGGSLIPETAIQRNKNVWDAIVTEWHYNSQLLKKAATDFVSSYQILFKGLADPFPLSARKRAEGTEGWFAFGRAKDEVYGVTGAVKAEAKAFADGFIPMITYAEAKNKIVEISEDYTDNLPKQLDLLRGYYETNLKASGATAELESAMGKLNRQSQIMAISRQYQEDYANALYMSGGNARILANELDLLNAKYADNTALQAQIKLKMDEVNRSQQDMGKAWNASLNYATNRQVDWFKNFKDGVDAMRTAWSDTFYDMFTTRTNTAKENFRQFALSITRIATNMMAQRFTADLMSLFLPSAPVTAPLPSGHQFGGGPLPGKAMGGIISRPTVTVVGEGGNAEAIVPLPDNKSIPVKMVGDGSGKSVNVHFNIQANDAEGFDKLLTRHQRTLSDLIANAMSSRYGFRRTMTA